MTNFTYTGVHPNDEQAQQIKAAVTSWQNTPVIAFSTAHALAGGASADAREHVMRTIYDAALANGLPAFEGYYGYDPARNEFTKPL